MSSSSEQTRPLVVRMGALGDMVMVTPLLKALFERSGQKVDLVACGEWNRKLFAHCPWINTIYTVDSRNAPYWFNRSKRALVKQLKPDAATRPWFLFEHLPALHQLMYRANCQKSQAFLTTDFPRKTGEHTCRQFLRMADAAFPPTDISSNPLATYLHCADEEIRECEIWLFEEKNIDYRAQKLVMIQAGNKKTMRKGKRDRASNIKYWPEQRWAELIDTIASNEPDCKILLCGAPSEANLCSDIAALCKPCSQQNIVQCALDLPLTRLMALATLAHACISVDTGPAHVAAALGCPLVVLFGQSDPRQFRPLEVSDVRIVANKNWESFTDSAEHWAAQNSMSDISVTQVFEAYRALQPRAVLDRIDYEVHNSIRMKKEFNYQPERRDKSPASFEPSPA